MYVIRVVKQEEVNPKENCRPGALWSPTVYENSLYEQKVEHLDLQKLILAIFLANPTASAEHDAKAQS